MDKWLYLARRNCPLEYSGMLFHGPESPLHWRGRGRSMLPHALPKPTPLFDGPRIPLVATTSTWSLLLRGHSSTWLIIFFYLHLFKSLVTDKMIFCSQPRTDTPTPMPMAGSLWKQEQHAFCMLTYRPGSNTLSAAWKFNCGAGCRLVMWVMYWHKLVWLDI